MKNTAKLLAIVACALLAPVAGCSDPLHVTIPDIVSPGSLGDTAALATLRAGAIGDFSIAYSGDHPDGSGGTGEGVIMYGGLLADEWIDSETFPTRIEVDARTIQLTNSDVDLWYRLLHQARNSAEKAAGQYAKLRPADPGHAETLSLAGFTYLFFAETFCSGVPVSHLDPATGQIAYGVPLSTQQLVDTAVARFDSALAAAAGIGDATVKLQMIELASVGKGRALLDRGDFAGAGTAVATVATDFAYLSEHSEISDFENNGVFNGNLFDQRYSIASQEGGNANGFAFRAANGDPTDPRTPSAFAGAGFDGSTELWAQLRYGDRKAGIVLASGVEARLIQAEAALPAADTATFLSQLNNPRANANIRTYFNASPFDRTDTLTRAVGALDSLTTTHVADSGAVNLLFAERARWLWLTAHRLGDLRRLVRQYLRPADSVFPSGDYFKTNPSVYGPDVNLPVPVTEKNNPNFSGCLDRLP